MSDTTIPPGGPLPPPGPPGASQGWGVPVPESTRDTTSAVRRDRPGRLAPAWRVMVVTTWVGVFIAYLAVWKASEELGLATWWLGPRANPQPVVIRLVPSLVAATFGIAATYNVRRLPVIGLVGAAALAAIAVPDLSRSTGIATIEFAIAGAVVLVSAASFTGMYRQARSDHGG